MNEALPSALLAGCALGALFFGGLWWTVQRLPGAARPGLWVFGSLLLRTAIALSGFYVVGHGDWRRLVACMLGFIGARLIIQQLTRRSAAGWKRLMRRSGNAHQSR